MLNVGLIGLGAVSGPLAAQWRAGGFPANVRFVGALTRRARADAPVPTVTGTTTRAWSMRQMLSCSDSQ